MAYYTVFDRYGSVDDVNIVFLCNSKADAESTCRYINGEMIRGKFADPQDYQLRFKQEDIRRKVIHYIEWTNNKGGRQFYLDGMEWKREPSDDDYDDDLEEGARKMSFNDMVKSIRVRKGIEQLLDEKILSKPNYAYADNFDIKIDGESHHFFTPNEGRNFYSNSLNFEMSLDGKGATFSYLGGDEAYTIPDIEFQEAIEEFENWCILKLKGHW